MEVLGGGYGSSSKIIPTVNALKSNMFNKLHIIQKKSDILLKLIK